MGFKPKNNIQIKTVVVDGEISVKKNAVNTFKELPDPSKKLDKLYFVRNSTFRHKRGFYLSNGEKWKKM